MISIETFGQTISDCDTIYVYVDTMPKYEKGTKGLMDYLTHDLVPILTDCIERDSTFITSMYLSLTIDKYGHVIDVNFIRIDASDQCKKELKQKMMTMTAWTAGMKDGKPVCCKYSWPISCLMWQ